MASRIVSITEIIVGEANIIAGVPSTIVCGMETVAYGTTLIVDAPSIMMSVAETIDSLTKLPMWRTEMIVSESSVIKDGPEIIVNETQLTVSVKRKSAGAEASERGVFDANPLACLVWVVVSR